MDKYDKIAESFIESLGGLVNCKDWPQFQRLVASLIRDACKPDGEYWGIRFENGIIMHNKEGDEWTKEYAEAIIKEYKNHPIKISCYNYSTARPVKISWRMEESDE